MTALLLVAAFVEGWFFQRALSRWRERNRAREDARTSLRVVSAWVVHRRLIGR